MASYQRTALFVFFDAIERDLISRIRSIIPKEDDNLLTEDEEAKAINRLHRRDSRLAASPSHYDLLLGLDLGDKLAVLMRHRQSLDDGAATYFFAKRALLERAIPVRNAIMHGRPLTTEEYASGFTLAQDFLSSPGYWPNLHSTYTRFSENPESYVASAMTFLDDEPSSSALHNLPPPDYDDTGFYPRPHLEQDLKRKILGRHPVITVLGEGGNGKSALALQTLYGLVSSNDHDFDAIVWVSAKASRLTVTEVSRIEGAITNSLGVFTEVADRFEPGEDEPADRVRRLLRENKVLLAIDNLETVLDEDIQRFVEDVPGESKILFTSRVPLGSDLVVVVDAFTETEARGFLKRLVEAYDVTALRKLKGGQMNGHIDRLGRKPLLLKWFALGVQAGLTPERISSEPEMALRFCMENVFERLTDDSKSLLRVLSLIPRPISATVLQYITSLPAAKIEIGLSELVRFALIEGDRAGESEYLYGTKPFVRSYLRNSLRTTNAEERDVVARYRTIEAAFQAEQGRNRGNRYDLRSFTVRSRSEALAARRLRHAMTLALKDRCSDAFDIVSELKISAPGYFEVLRTEAFVSYRANDTARANTAYIAALDLAEDQPQLHAAYAGLLMRSFGDYVGASDHYRRALELDGDSAFLLREAARNYFFLYEFDDAQLMLDRSWAKPRPTHKDEIFLADLQIQLYVRNAEFLNTKGDPCGASDALLNLAKFITGLQANVMDTTLLDHLRKALSVIDVTKRSSAHNAGESLQRLSRIIEDIILLSYPSAVAAMARNFSTVVEEANTGTLKERGRQENYGFIVDAWGNETFVSKSEVEAIVWSDMCSGRAVSFMRVPDSIGRLRARNILLI